MDPAADVDLVVALIGIKPVMTMSFHDLGRALLLGKYIALRSMEDDAELRALHEGLDKIDVNDRAALYAERKRHKETTVLLHEVAHALGALHTRAADDLMHPTYDAHMLGFAAPNLDLMRYSLDERTAEDKRDPEELVKRARELSHEFQMEWLDRRRASEPLGCAAQDVGSPCGNPSSGGDRGRRGGPEQAVCACGRPDSACGTRPSDIPRNRWAESARRVERGVHCCHRLGGSLPKVSGSAAERCELGMQFGVSLERLQPYCARMNSLLSQ